MTSENKEEVSAPKLLRRERHRETGFEQWGGYMASKKMKLAAQFDNQRQTESEDQGEVETEIFKGVAIFVNGYTKPSANELKRLMMVHGGMYHHYYSTTKTTHTIASNLPNSKIKNLKNQIVVTPNWITDSIMARKLLPYQDYLLYSPEVTHKQQRLKLENFTCSKVTQNNAENADKSDSNSLQYDLEENNVDYLRINTSEIPENFNHEGKFSNSTTSVAGASTVSPSKNDGPATAGQPGFLSEFYSHSRLHHISTAGQELKRYVQTLVDSHNSLTFTGRERLKELVQKDIVLPLQKENCSAMKSESQMKNQQIIMHLDMDCFFVSVGLRKHPDLRGKPVAVTHSKGKKGGPQDGSDIHFEAAHYENQSKKKIEGVTSAVSDLCDEELEEENQKTKISKYSKEYGSLSEIASCSYEARKAGIRNGMFLGEALRRCPNLKTIPYDFEGYSEVSKQLYDIVASYTLDIEAVSCDELYVDCTQLLQETCVSPLEFSSVLRAEIEKKTGCTASAGLGPNMLLARLANRVAKPNGQYYVSLETIEHFIITQKVRDLPGVGYTTSSKFEHLGVVTCGDLQGWSLTKLQQEFGPKTGQTLFNRCRGKDDRVVQLQKERKSVSAEINYGIRFEQEEEVYKFLKELSFEVASRLRSINAKGKSITLKLMVRHPEAPVQTAKFMGHGVCDHISKSVVLKSATDDPACIGNECCLLARSFKIKPEDYRGIGIQLSKLESNQKDTKGHKTLETFLCSNIPKSETGRDVNQEIFAPKDIEPENKTLTKGVSIKDFFSDKSSPSKRPTYRPPPLEELDQSVLNALPQDLQKEVLEMFGTKPLPKPLSHMSHSNASTHHSSSNSRPVACKKGVSHPAKKSETTSKNTLYNCFDSFKRQSSDDKEVTGLKKKSATIGGAESINEVRSLVKEWVLSSQVVLDEDIDQFKDYILQVIDEDLKKVDLVLKYFHRVVSTANTMWQQAYLTVLSYVQQKMLQKFGTMLDAKSDFST